MPKIVDHDERRQEIALAACQAIAKKGLDAVRLSDIAREAGCTTGMLAHYFTTKWDVILAALRLMHVRLERRLSDRLRDQEIGLADLLQDALPTTPEYRAESAAWLTFWGVAVSRPDLLKRTAQMHSDWRSLVRRCVLETTPAARTWPEELTEDVVSSIIFFMDGLYVKALTQPDLFPPKEQLRLWRAHIEALLSAASAVANQGPVGRGYTFGAVADRRLKAPTGG
jgi:TetR/AcrR family transcriptional regulator, transcriptional repressor of bet genes